MATKPTTKGSNMANNDSKPHAFCKQCDIGCDEAAAKRLHRHGQCDPCDACMNSDSPACLTCEAFSNFWLDDVSTHKFTSDGRIVKV